MTLQTSTISAASGPGLFADKKRMIRLARQYAPFIAFILLIVCFSFASPVFFSVNNFLNIGRQTALVTIMAVGMTILIVSGELDLSIGATLALSGVTAAMAMQATGDNMAIGILVGLATGGLIGAINGTLTTRLKIPSFLVTLGMMGIARGTALLLTGTMAVPVMNMTFWDVMGGGNIYFIPATLVFSALALIGGAYILHFTAFGRRIYAVGGNAKAARYSGINVARVKTMAFIGMGSLSGLAGLILTARFHAARPDTAAGIELDVLAAVILGGTSLFGGRGLIIGSLLGSLLIGVLNNGLTLMSVTSSAQLVIKGIIIIAAVAFSSER
ncbi:MULTISPECIES: ABC transporter permease [Agrobacterium]|uniref:ABC transporter permease n=1 Tax=Agrobacterium rubi TaxID=28099 RepID=A0AAE7US12_9HYPH|nr:MULTISPECIES: ABC transporter permease [Agrobacterium]MBN7807842.1 ABC transporter permease [Agrobacterium rosae]NTE89802.1 ABC transporter permease [Agrobacterium rubi]NTF05348.1 ABC transporter permease [Agrobacterium rubi]NTF39792.1 ABC transporter permease [Agrobacterium rubi]OCJ44899.1 ABC transporter permease [Agrobacterium rubi]